MYGYLRHLANFANIVEAGSITGAANKLDCSPSSMSESVKILEAHFNEPLLERRQRGVFPTSKGAAIYDDCRMIVQACDNAVGGSTDELSGTVKVSIPAEFLISFGARLARLVKEQAPQIGLVLAAENKVLDQTKFARDLYVRVAKQEEHPNLNVLHSNLEQVVLVGHRELVAGKDTDAPNVVSSFPYLGGLSSKSKQSLKLNQPSEELVFSDLIQVGSIEARISMMKDKAGITACLKSTISAELNNGMLVQLLPKRFGFSLFATIGSPHRNPNVASRLVAQAIADIQSVISNG